MRIIAGFHRGRRLLGPEGKGTTRPITDRVKTSLFDRLAAAHRLEDAVVLDLFSGTGSMGLECLSRGAQHVTFVDRDRVALDRLRKNLDTLSYGSDVASVLSVDALGAGLPAMFGTAEPLTLLFIDPPYAMMTDEKDAARIYQQITRLASVSADDAWLILRTDKNVAPTPIETWGEPHIIDKGAMRLHIYRGPGYEGKRD
jgi:16S rRNA (guanine966-N2)-methyltransferase